MKLGFNLTAIVVVALALVTFSCDVDDRHDELAPKATVLAIEEDPDGTDHKHDDPLIGFEAEIVDHVTEHGVNFDDLEQVRIQRPDGSVDEVYMLEGDIEITEDQLRENQGCYGRRFEAVPYQ